MHACMHVCMHVLCVCIVCMYCVYVLCVCIVCVCACVHTCMYDVYLATHILYTRYLAISSLYLVVCRWILLVLLSCLRLRDTAIHTCFPWRKSTATSRPSGAKQWLRAQRSAVIADCILPTTFEGFTSIRGTV